MRCPSCGKTDTKVIDSRPVDANSSIRRRRECLVCQHRFTTYERTGDPQLLITKSDGSVETYNREKLLRGVTVACAKRPITPEQITSIIDAIENELRTIPKSELTSKKLGTMVLDKLAILDEVAYVRFASVYKDFKNIEEFASALEDMR